MNNLQPGDLVRYLSKNEGIDYVFLVLEIYRPLTGGYNRRVMAFHVDIEYCTPFDYNQQEIGNIITILSRPLNG